MRNEQKGFTLIELVVVIVIIGILAAVAVPKFIDLSGEARLATTQGVAGALSSSSVTNYAADIAKGQIQGAALASAAVKTGIVATATGCTNTVAGNLMQAGVSFAASGAGTYAVSGAASITNVGDSVTCTVTNNDDTAKTATFVLLGAK